MSFLNNKLQLNRICYQSIRMRAEFKFKKTQKLQQNRIFGNLYYNKEKDCTKTESVCATDLIKEKPIVVSKGRHSYVLDEIRDKPLTRRMIVLNKQFMSCITDLLSTQSIVDLKSFDINITQVRVSRNYSMLNIYWYSPTNYDEKSIETIARSLENLKGELHEKIIERQFIAHVPWINFVLDKFETFGEEVADVLRTVDLGDDCDVNDDKQFETPYQTVGCFDAKPNSKFSETRETQYDFVTLQKPSDMKMDVLGLDYEHMINIVLANLKKSRALHRSFNAVADPLPPIDWSMPVVSDQTNAIYDTDNRIKEMKRFLIENRKKKQRLSREARKQAILEQYEISEHLSDVKQRMDESVSVYDDIQDSEDYSDDDSNL